MKHRVLPGIFLLVLVGLAGWMAFREEGGTASYAGYVEADLYLLGFELPGKILRVAVEEGDRVGTVDTLVVLDTTDLHLERVRLEEEMAAGKQALVALDLQLDLERKTYARYASMDTGSVPAVQLEAMETKIRTLEAKRTEARHRLQALETALQGVQERLRRAVLTAPRDGVVLDVLAREGEAVLPGRPVVRLGVTDTVEVIAFLPEPDLPRYRPGDTLWIRADGITKALPGELVWIAPEAEYASGYVQTEESRKDLVFRARIRVANPEGVLKLGMPVDVFPARP